jgi:predicted DNA binding CopG/RHH family protein
MSDNHADPDAELKAALAKSKQDIIAEAGKRGKREKTNRTSIVKAARLRSTGRVELWTFRCNPDLRESIKAHAKKQGVPYAAWMEKVLEAALAAETTEVNGGIE